MRLGKLSYINVMPVDFELEKHWHGEFPLHIETVTHPTQLNAMLREGALDLAPVSAVELLQGDYGYLDGLCIGADGPVMSVVLCSRVPLEKLDGRTVALTPASATSRWLVQLLLENARGVHPVYIDSDTEADAALLIGDRALRRPVDADPFRYDLGSLWREWTGLPMVFAVWAYRKAAAAAAHVVGQALRENRRRLQQQPDAMIDAATAQVQLPRPYVCKYFDHMRYDLDSRARAGLNHFLSLVKHEHAHLV